MNLDRIKSLGNRHLLFLTFSTTIFLKSVVFTAVTAQLAMPNALWTGYADIFTAFWIGKLLPALLLGAFVYLPLRRQWWTIVVCLLTDVWILADLFYFKANGFHLTPEVIAMADNMQGFESSLLGLLGWDVYVFPLITIGYTIAYFVLRLPKHNVRSGKTFGIILAISLLADCGSNYNFDSNFYNIRQGIDPSPSFSERLQRAFPFGFAYRAAKNSIFSWMPDLAELNFIKGYLFNQSYLTYQPCTFIRHGSLKSTHSH